MKISEMTDGQIICAMIEMVRQRGRLSYNVCSDNEKKTFRKCINELSRRSINISIDDMKKYI